MADDELEYVYQSAKVVRGTEDRTIRKWQANGWELHTRSHALVRTELTFRRVKPKSPVVYIKAFATKTLTAFRGLQPATQRRVLAGASAVVVLIILGSVIAGIAGGGDTTKPSAVPTNAAVEPSETPEETPSQDPSEEPSNEPSVEASSEPAPAPTKTPKPSKPAEATGPVTPAQVLSAFQAFIDERAAANVMVAKAVTEISLDKRVITVTFDPAAAGVSQAQFDAGNSFDNPYDPSESLADFASSPISSNDDAAVRLRAAIDSITAVHANGKTLGTRTTAEIIKLNGLDK